MPETVRAAGGVVRRRRADGAWEYAVIHRPRYDDWSLPKGKLDEGESWEDAALREVREETGMGSRLLRELGAARYRDSRGRDKVARYWLMEPVDGEFRPTDEVDELRWLPLDQALLVLSYERDRSLVRRASGSDGEARP